VDYPAIRAMHEASSLATGEEVAAWRIAPMRQAPTPNPAAPAGAAGESIETVILRRGSTRHFGGRSISDEELSTILRAATARLDADFVAPSELLADVYVIVNAVDGLQSGSYFYDRQRGTLELLRAGDFRREAGFLDLGQDLAQDAAVNLYWLADL